MRIQGIGDIRDIDFCTLEANGKISMLKKRNTCGATAHPLIIDGELNENEIRLLDMTKKEVEYFANETKIEDIFLLTIDDNRSANIIIKEEI